MEKRRTKPRFIDVFCPDQNCKFYGVSGKENNAGNGTYYKIKDKTEHNEACIWRIFVP